MPSDDLLNSGSASKPDVFSPIRDLSDCGPSGPSGGPTATIGSAHALPAAGYSRRLGQRGAVGLLLSAALVGSAVFTTSSATAAPKPKATAKPKKIVVPATGPGSYRSAKVDARPASSSGRLIRFDVKVEENLDIAPDEAAKLPSVVY